MSPLKDEVVSLVSVVLNCSFSLHSLISLSRPRHVDDAPVDRWPGDRWPIVFVKLNKLSTAFTCRVSNAI